MKRMGLFGESYGYEDAEGISPTEREYDCATANHKYRVVLIKRADNRHPKELALIRKAEQDVVRSPSQMARSSSTSEATGSSGQGAWRGLQYTEEYR